MSDHSYDLLNSNDTIVFATNSDKLDLEKKIGTVKTKIPVAREDKYIPIGMLVDTVKKYKGEIVDIKPEYDPKNVFSLRKFVVDLFQGYFN